MATDNNQILTESPENILRDETIPILSFSLFYTHTHCSVAQRATPVSSAAGRGADGMTERFCVIGGVIEWIKLGWIESGGKK